MCPAAPGADLGAGFRRAAGVSETLAGPTAGHDLLLSAAREQRARAGRKAASRWDVQTLAALAAGCWRMVARGSWSRRRKRTGRESNRSRKKAG